MEYDSKRQAFDFDRQDRLDLGLENDIVSLPFSDRHALLDLIAAKRKKLLAENAGKAPHRFWGAPNALVAYSGALAADAERYEALERVILDAAPSVSEGAERYLKNAEA